MWVDKLKSQEEMQERAIEAGQSGDVGALLGNGDQTACEPLVSDTQRA